MDFVIDDRFDVSIKDDETCAQVMDRRLNVQRFFLDNRVGWIEYDDKSSLYIAEYSPYHKRRGIKDFDNILDAVDYIIRCVHESEGKLNVNVSV